MLERGNLSRRGFLRRNAAALAAAGVPARYADHVLAAQAAETAANKKTGANGKLNMGFIGIGSPQSRNRSVGERLGRGEGVEAILGGMEQVAEGVWTCGTALELARRAGVPVPVMEQVDAIVLRGKKPREAVVELMRREARPERD